jgi:LCP family protein required for cell wall assembly
MVVVLASVLPGLGHLLAGRVRTGLALLAAAAATVVGGAYALRSVRPEQVMVRPGLLLAVAVALLTAGLLWCAVICSAYRASAPVGQARVAPLRGRVVVLAVCLAVMTPAALSAQQVHAAARALEVFADNPPGGPRTPFDGHRRINLLLLGSDAGRDRTGARTDVIVIASIDTATGQTALISLPRNLQNIPLRPGTRLARAYPDGFRDFWFGLYTAVQRNPTLWPGVSAKRAAATAMADTVGYVTKLPIDRYVVIGMAGFRRLIDALGGVTLRVRSGDGRPIPIGGSHSAGGRVLSRPHGQIPLGEQHLGGEQALWYVRSRFNAGDGERQARQRCFLTALARQSDPTSVARAVRRFTAASRQVMLTNVTRAELADLVALARRDARTARIDRVTILDVVGSSYHPNIRAIRHRLAAVMAGHAAPLAFRDYGVNRPMC